MIKWKILHLTRCSCMKCANIGCSARVQNCLNTHTLGYVRLSHHSQTTEPPAQKPHSIFSKHSSSKSKIPKFLQQNHRHYIVPHVNNIRNQWKMHPKTLSTSIIALFLGAGTFIGVYFGFKQSIAAECEAALSIDSPAQKTEVQKKGISLSDAISESRDMIQRIKDEHGVPGVSVSVTVDGVPVWDEGCGFADVENRSPVTKDTVMRIASISKPMTMAIIGRLVEEGKLDLDLPVTHYVKEWPQKYHDGKEVNITIRNLACHMSGVRHYDKLCGRKIEGEDKATSQKKRTAEFYLNKPFKSTKEALELFKDDDLCHEPGSKFLYTTHGYTLLGAVAEAASGQSASQLFNRLFTDLNMKNSYLDKHQPIIYHRARGYQRDKTGRLQNAPYSDSSYKYYGGGLLATASDLTIFGNAMLYAFQHCQKQPGRRAVLSQDTLQQLWQPANKGVYSKTKPYLRYALGWEVVPSNAGYGGCSRRFFLVSHTGGAVGASSVLTILPRGGAATARESAKAATPQGVVVAIIVNLESVSVYTTAMRIAELFDHVAL